jgi:RNA polymerase sigma factor (sigma-70 family)
MDQRPEFPQHDLKTRADFDALCDELRPDLHRFCARMLGDACEGEDVLQDALVLAFHRFLELKEVHSLRAWLFQVAHNKCIDHLRTRRRFEPISDAMSDAAPAPDDELAKRQRALLAFHRFTELKEVRSLRAWLFQVAHNKCIDHLRTRRRFEPISDAMSDAAPAPDDELAERQRALLAFSSLITDLPAKERASLLLKDVFDCSLEEDAEITESSLGAVKDELHLCRAKLDALGERSKAHRRRSPRANASSSIATFRPSTSAIGPACARW